MGIKEAYKRLLKKEDKNNKEDINAFDSKLAKVGGNIPQELEKYIYDNYFLPMFREALPYVDEGYDFRDASLVRLKTNGIKHTRVVICDNCGNAIEAFNVYGKMGDLLWFMYCVPIGKEVDE